jgi:hypothetical protein
VPVVAVGVTTHQGERESRSQDEGAQVLTIDNDGEVREMRNATTVLTIIHYEHWRAGCPESGHVRFYVDRRIMSSVGMKALVSGGWCGQALGIIRAV